MAKARDAIGLDIGTSGVRAAQVALAKHPFGLENFGQVSLPSGAMRDGEIVDPTTVARAIAELWSRAGFKKKVVGLGIANQKVVARPVDLPYMAEEELRGSIRFQVQEYIPIPVDDAILDYQILGEFTSETGDRMLRVLLVAAQKDMVNSFVETVERAGLSLSAVDFIPLALIRALGDSGESFPRVGGEAEAIIDVGAGLTNIVVHEGGQPRFARVLSVGGNDLTDAIAAGLGVSFDDAESIKQRLGFTAPVSPPSTAAPGEPQQSAAAQGDMATRILEQRAAAFVDEIRGSLDYYMAAADSTRIARVMLSGGASKLPGLPQRLANALRLPVEQGKVLRRLRVGRVGLSEAQLAEAEPLMASAIGIAIGEAE